MSSDPGRLGFWADRALRDLVLRASDSAPPITPIPDAKYPYFHRGRYRIDIISFESTVVRARLLHILISCLFVYPVIAQSKYIPEISSILKNIEDAQSIEEKVSHYFLASNYYRHKTHALDSQLHYLQLAMTLSETHNYIVGIGESLQYQSQYYCNVGQYHEGVSAVRRAIQIAKSSKRQHRLSEYYTRLTMCYALQGLQDSSHYWAIRTLESLDEQQYGRRMYAHINASEALNKMSMYPQAEDHLLSAYKESQNTKKKEQFICLSYLLNHYSSYQISKQKWAKHFALYSQLYEEIFQSHQSYHHSLLPESMDYSLRVDFLKESISHFKKNQAQENIYLVYQQLINLQYEHQRYLDGLATIKDAKTWTTGSETDQIRYQVDFMFLEANILEQIGEHSKALTITKSAHKLQDSLRALVNEQTMADLQEKYETAQKEKTIEMQANKLNTRKLQSWILGIGLLSTLLIGIFIWRQQKQKNQLLTSTNELNQQKIVRMEKENKILALSSMIEGQESERNRIAKDLHDGLGSLLTSVKAHFGRIEEEIKKIENLNIYRSAQNMMDDACEEVRRISHNLMPPILRSSGISAALRNLVHQYDNSTVEFHIQIADSEARFSETIEIFVYRIAQELLSNAMNHAAPSKVELSYYVLDEVIQLIVEDNGSGFVPQQIYEGLGLHSVRSRVDYLSGHMDIESYPGRGTTVSIEIPKTTDHQNRHDK